MNPLMHSFRVQWRVARKALFLPQPLRLKINRAVLIMIKTTTTISNKLGLHARASAKLTKLAGSFACEVWLSKGERRVNAKSIMGVMMLAAGIGSVVELETNGQDEEAATKALLALIADKFGEGE
jgi:phosphocarrier protein